MSVIVTRAGEDPAWWMTNLRHSVQALAMPADVQRSLFPDFAPATDELWNCFGQFRHSAESVGDPVFSDEQQARLDALDARLRAMSDEDREGLWTDEALRTRPEWEEVRRLATETLQAFGWTVEAPPPSFAGTYAQVLEPSTTNWLPLGAWLARYAGQNSPLRRERLRRAVRWPLEKLTGWRRRA